MNDTSHNSPFEAIRHQSEDGSEYWSARDLSKILGYATNYRNFRPAIEKAKEACKNSGQEIADHFADMRNMVNSGTMPEDLPTPATSIQQLQVEEQKRLQEGQQPSLFDSLDKN